MSRVRHLRLQRIDQVWLRYESLHPVWGIDSEWGDRYAPYNYSGGFTDANAFQKFLRFDAFRNPTEWIVNGDSCEWALDVPTTGFVAVTPSATEPNKRWAQGDPDRHSEAAANYLYLYIDGHAANASGEEAFYGLRDPEDKKSLTYNGP